MSENETVSVNRRLETELLQVVSLSGAQGVVYDHTIIEQTLETNLQSSLAGFQSCVLTTGSGSSQSSHDY